MVWKTLGRIPCYGVYQRIGTDEGGILVTRLGVVELRAQLVDILSESNETLLDTPRRFKLTVER
jgi:hypothetical protein